MRVITNPGLYDAQETTLSAAVQVENWGIEDYIDVYKYAVRVAEQNAALVELLVEKGVLTLADCQALGAPHMEEVK
jgi:hypothetical protein